MSKDSVMGNIGVKEGARLRAVGLVGITGGLALGVVVLSYDVPWWVRPALFLSLWIGASGLLQARGRTSVLLAARRVRKIDGREERERYVLTLTERARVIQLRSLFVAVLLVALITLFE